MNEFLSYLLLAPPILFAVTIHEYAHGWMAEKFGDLTAKLAGRLTLNPLAHLDLLGTLMLFLVKIGWAKPVPVNPYNLRHPRRDMVWISLAGPLANLSFAILCGLLLRLFLILDITPEGWLKPIFIIILYAFFINVALAAFNIIPIPPLDGSKILTGLIPHQWALKYRQLERYGPLLLIAIIFLGRMIGFDPLGGLIFYLVDLVSFLVIGKKISSI
ncbi:MAG: site-2 protease family protein [Candidatus Edwardsbacteria bacterium]